jgi:hypothetical protein
MNTIKERGKAAPGASALRRAQLASGRPDTPPAGNVAVIAAELSVVRCRWCNDDLEHCHDSLVVHAASEAHCMDPTCTAQPDAHHMLVSCSDFGCTCAVGDPAAASRSA